MLTTETLNPSGRLLMKPLALALAAARRLGETSSAFIDKEASMATTIVARSRGTFSMPIGRAHAKVVVARHSSAAATAMCLFHCGCLLITEPRIAVLVNLIAVERLRCRAQM